MKEFIWKIKGECEQGLFANDIDDAWMKIEEILTTLNYPLNDGWYDRWQVRRARRGDPIEQTLTVMLRPANEQEYEEQNIRTYHLEPIQD